MSGTRGVRDRALLLLGFAAALRRAELVALDVEDLQFVKQGVVLIVRRSKTDQEGYGRKIAVPYGRTHACAVGALQDWLQHATIQRGPVFRPVGKGGRIHGGRLTPQSVALVLKGYARASGLDASEISGHSLRSGLVTSAAQAGVPAHKIQQQSGHRSLEMLARYIRDTTIFENNAAGLLL
jgi:integrase